MVLSIEERLEWLVNHVVNHNQRETLKEVNKSLDIVDQHISIGKTRNFIFQLQKKLLILDSKISVCRCHLLKTFYTALLQIPVCYGRIYKYTECMIRY